MRKEWERKEEWKLRKFKSFNTTNLLYNIFSFKETILKELVLVTSGFSSGGGRGGGGGGGVFCIMV